MFCKHDLENEVLAKSEMLVKMLGVSRHLISVLLDFMRANRFLFANYQWDYDMKT